MSGELLAELVRRAHSEESVAFASLRQDVQLLVYPIDHRLLIGVGVEGERAQRVDISRVLHKRSSDMARFGDWLPARMKDGSCYVFKRIASYDLDRPVLDPGELDIAEELLT
jgi:hypothetical protein